MTVVAQVTQRCATLPLDTQVDVLDFVAFLASRETPRAWAVAERQAVVAQTMGGLRETSTSSEAFAQRKAAEHAREDVGRHPTRNGGISMARVLAGTPPQVVARSPIDTQQALAWLQAHYETFRGQWVAVRLRDPALIAQAPTLTQLWQVAAPAALQDCLIQYVSTVKNDQQVPGLEWDA
jgi:hypothetical protein